MSPTNDDTLTATPTSRAWHCCCLPPLSAHPYPSHPTRPLGISLSTLQKATSTCTDRATSRTTTQRPQKVSVALPTTTKNTFNPAGRPQRCELSRQVTSPQHSPQKMLVEGEGRTLRLLPVHNTDPLWHGHVQQSLESRLTRAGAVMRPPPTSLPQTNRRRMVTNIDALPGNEHTDRSI